MESQTDGVAQASLEGVDLGRLAARVRSTSVAEMLGGLDAPGEAVAAEALGVSVQGRDVSEHRIKQALQPAAISATDRRARFVACHFAAALSGPFDVVVSNPPYVMTGDIADLAPEVHHDPRRALDGGPDGLGCYRTIAGQVGRLLAPGGHLVVELGFGQEAQVAAIFRAAGLAPRPAHTDLSGIPRALCAAVPD